MEQLVQAINVLCSAIETQNIPRWITITSMVAPIALTVLTIILTLLSDYRNRQLQKLLHNRDVVNQSRALILDIYNSFLKAFMIASQASGSLGSIFSSEQSFYQWGTSIEQSRNDLIEYCNRAKLIFGDPDGIAYLERCRDSWVELDISVHQYIFTGEPVSTIQKAWNNVSAKYGIQRGYYYGLYTNPIIGKEFTELCETAFTGEIQRRLEDYIRLVGTEKFDDHFKKYLQLNEV